ncbi:cupin domain-containing protein [Acinetobacter rudis]|uniref:cupin domain-containing protein n=1 Tax=Acinetobacter rudis TaxID=632955 RepID=UPI00333E37F7
MNIRLNNKALFETNTGLKVLEVDLTTILPEVPFELSQFTVAVDGHSPDESHEEREIWIITSGSGQLKYKGAIYNLIAGQAVTFSPNIVHTIKNTGETTLNVISIWWKEQ